MDRRITPAKTGVLLVGVDLVDVHHIDEEGHPLRRFAPVGERRITGER